MTNLNKSIEKQIVDFSQNAAENTAWELSYSPDTSKDLESFKEEYSTLFKNRLLKDLKEYLGYFNPNDELNQDEIELCKHEFFLALFSIY